MVCLAIRTALAELRRNGECLVELDMPMLGSSTPFYFVKTDAQLNDLWSGLRAGGVMIAYRGRRYPLEGAVDDSLIAAVRDTAWDGKTQYDLLEANTYPDELEWITSGRTWEDLARHLERVRGKQVRFGREPERNQRWWEREDRDWDWGSSVSSRKGN